MNNVEKRISKSESSSNNGLAEARNGLAEARNGLAEARGSARTFGCVGFSVVAHAAFLAALALAPHALQNISGSDAGSQGGSGGNSISMIDIQGDVAMPAAASGTTPVEVSVMTDSTSDIVMPEKIVKPVKIEAPKVVEKPKVKTTPPPVVKSAKTPRPQSKPSPKVEANDVAAVETPNEELNETPPVLLANPPNEAERNSSDTPITEAAVAETVATPEENPAEKPEDKPVEKSDEPVEETPVASSVVETSNRADEGAGEAQNSTSQNTSQSTATSESAGDGNGHSKTQSQGAEGSGTSAGAIAGPIRDASELKALQGNPNPVYPARDRLAKKQGTTVVLGRVSPDGRVTEAKLERSSGSQMMDQASVQAFRSWRFQPGQEGWVRKPFQFRLVGEAREVPAPLGKALTR